MKYLALAFCVSALSSAVAAPVLSPPIPELKRPVMDEAGLLSSTEIRALEERILALNQARGIQVAVYVPQSLRGETIEAFAIQVADLWKLGEEKTDRGLLLVVAPNERKMRLEVGYGLEGDLTDLWSKRTLDNMLRPALRQNEPAQGLANVLAEISRQLSLSPEARAFEEKARRQQSSSNKTQSPGLGFLLLVAFVFLIQILRFRYTGRLGGFPLGGLGGGWNSRGGGGGYRGGGGGFGGGGASSGW